MLLKKLTNGGKICQSQTRSTIKHIKSMSNLCDFPCIQTVLYVPATVASIDLIHNVTIKTQNSSC